ncbi:hypothetical protein Goshw_004389 [Gossypium schwendimanii]|uniref:RNase H type-1 domain-containing protein n=1 Tax=Gossypium schwendimanii TaxID=34291 RepID=A0A7J9L7S2_GOSSC|nr:hypothetical protein [Gossypium schwendimanii]
MTEVKVLVLKSLLNIEITSPFVAKVRACSQAVWLGLAMGVDKLKEEGDALTLIKKCQSIAIDKSHHNRRGRRGAEICSGVTETGTSERTRTRLKSVLGFLKIKENDGW